MPHVPLSTQPKSAFPVRLSPNPILTSQSDDKHKNFVQSTITGQAARGLASVEFVFEDQHQHHQLADEAYAAEPGAGVGFGLVFGFGLGDQVLGEGERERKRRWKEVEEAVSWEKEARRKRAAVKAAA
jgi:chromatin structure-remodeling complex protein RSC7